MNENRGNIQKVRHLKWQRLVQHNLLFIILFLLSIYFVWFNKPDYLFLGILCLLLWMIAAQRLYASVTGEMVGTNISKLIQSFEKYKSGDKKWLRKKKTESMTIGIVAILLTIFLITMSLSFNKNDLNMDMNSIYIIILSWVALNVGEIIRIKNTIV